MAYLDINEVLEEISLAKKIGITFDCVRDLGNIQHHNTEASGRGEEVGRVMKDPELRRRQCLKTAPCAIMTGCCACSEQPALCLSRMHPIRGQA